MLTHLSLPPPALQEALSTLLIKYSAGVMQRRNRLEQQESGLAQLEGHQLAGCVHQQFEQPAPRLCEGDQCKRVAGVS